MEGSFIRDLNEYFAKKYANYERISAMPSYESVTISMLLKNMNRIEEGESVSDEARKICSQPKKEAVLEELKERYIDDNFSFSFRIARMQERLACFLKRRQNTGALLSSVIRTYGEDPAKLAPRLSLSEQDWAAVLRGKYIPEKVLLFRLFLLLGMRQEDCARILHACGAFLNLEDARDVVVCYLLDYRIFNPDMVAAAFGEFRIRPII